MAQVSWVPGIARLDGCTIRGNRGFSLISGPRSGTETPDSARGAKETCGRAETAEGGRPTCKATFNMIVSIGLYGKGVVIIPRVLAVHIGLLRSSCSSIYSEERSDELSATLLTPARNVGGEGGPGLMKSRG